MRNSRKSESTIPFLYTSQVLKTLRLMDMENLFFIGIRNNYHLVMTVADMIVEDCPKLQTQNERKLLMDVGLNSKDSR